MSNNSENQKPLVVLVHGWMGGPFHMSRLEKKLKKEGFETLNVDYPSTNKSLVDLRDDVYQAVKAVHKQGQPLYFIGFSMGGVLSRMVIEEYTELKKDLVRTAFIGSPMSGCELSKFGDNLPEFLKVLPGRAVFELKIQAEEWKDNEIDFDACVIAGSGGNMILGSEQLLRKSGEKESFIHDGVVRLDETTVKGAKDTIILPIDHHFMPHGRSVREQVVLYLTTGQLDHEKEYKQEFSPAAYLRSRTGFFRRSKKGNKPK